MFDHFSPLTSFAQSIFQDVLHRYAGSFNASLFFLTLSSLICLALARRFLWPMVIQAIDNKIIEIKDHFRQADDAMTAALSLSDAQKERVIESERAALLVLDNAKLHAQQQMHAGQAAVDAVLAREKKRSLQRLQALEAEALRDIQAEAIQLSMDEVEMSLKSLSQAQQGEIMTGFLAQLRKSPSS